MLYRCGHGLASSIPAWRSVSLCRISAFNGAPAFRAYATDRSSPPSHDIAVLGGGISGLAAAYYLTKYLPKARITIYEAADRVGGWVDSKRIPVDGGSIIFESGIRTLRFDKNGVLAAKLLQELDLAKDAIYTQRTAPAARNRYVYYPDRLVRLPHPSYGIPQVFWSLLTEPALKSVVWSGLTEVTRKARDASVEDESIGDFLTRRMSRTMVDRLVSAVIHGIYAGDVWKLSAKSLFSALWRYEGQEGSVLLGMVKTRSNRLEMPMRDVELSDDVQKFSWDPRLRSTMKLNSAFTFKDGVGMLTDSLTRHLLGTGQVSFRVGAKVRSIEPAKGQQGVRVELEGHRENTLHSHVVSALSPEHLNTVARKTSAPQSPRLIPPIPSVTVMVVNLYFKTPNMHPPGFGYLIPQATPFEKNPERALGVVFDTAYSPPLLPTHTVRSKWDEWSKENEQKTQDGKMSVNIEHFAWYNIPETPNHQDQVEERGTKLTVMIGGHWWDDWPAYPDEKEGLALARSVLERQLGIKEEPLVWQVSLQKNCIPQYTVGHEQRLKQARSNIQQEYRGRLRVVGNWMRGVGLNDCLRSAYDMAKYFHRDTTGLEHVGEPNVEVTLTPAMAKNS